MQTETQSTSKSLDLFWRSNATNPKISSTEFIARISQIQSLMTRASTYKVDWKAVEPEYQKLYSELVPFFESYNIENPNPFKKLVDFYGYWSMKLGSYQERRDYVNGLYLGVEAILNHKQENNHYFHIIIVENMTFSFVMPLKIKNPLFGNWPNLYLKKLLCGMISSL